MKAWLKAVAISCAILITLGVAVGGAMMASPALAQDARAVSNDLVAVWVETALSFTSDLRTD
ncbi:hypothetical protein [Rhodovibrio salinarum]|uniref:Uncharacterized protein n=1 Tax=Rhodovibrio salinarum TaxID=1087 RepID=A0A934QG98_9PROT|nr:hypothetical protein [Rhodovibrio salinarum]MBK1695955.1 hypothetical protein [Rhodovibrio salinarum]